ncbi:MAG: ankyrin repeat domain-containing protein [candidate division WOR-3 bacterium]|nr:MAG: ankyrin repeat domain-containing protein [candidate division WOR-3 bacterium]
MKIAQKLSMLTAMITFSGSAVAQNIFDAVDKGDIERITFLITKDPECANQREEKYGLTPLHMAASNGQIDICKVLIEKGADVHATDYSQRTALHFVAYHGHPEMIKLFIDKGIDANAQDNNGYTPILWAIFGKKTNTINELVQHGADLNPPIRLGRSVLHLAAASSNAEIIEYLLKKGIDINAKSDYGNTPLFWALRAKNYDNIKILIENGADLDVINNDGHTPISLAVSNNDTEMVDLLSKYGVNIKKQNSSGDTHLHAAAYQGHKEMIIMLLQKGVNPNLANDQGITPLDLAIHRNNVEVQQLLHSAGAERGKGKEKNNSQSAKIGKLGAGIENPVKITIIYDNYVYKEGMEADWGFSCYVEGTDKNIIFDTGTKSDLFIHNLKKLGIDHNRVDIVVLSHEHGDHTGGLFPFLEMNHNLSVIMPYSFSYNFVRRVESYGAKALAVKNPFEICKDVYLSGELDARMIREQSLAINTEKGLVVIGGCCHPGIINVVKNFKETLNKDIYMVVGGFHLVDKTDQEVSEIIDQMKELGVQKCGASHCTGERQIQMIKEAFGDDYITMGVGRMITF